MFRVRKCEFSPRRRKVCRVRLELSHVAIHNLSNSNLWYNIVCIAKRYGLVVLSVIIIMLSVTNNLLFFLLLEGSRREEAEKD
jgi:hypothetical protein